MLLAVVQSEVAPVIISCWIITFLTGLLSFCQDAPLLTGNFIQDGRLDTDESSSHPFFSFPYCSGALLTDDVFFTPRGSSETVGRTLRSKQIQVGCLEFDL